MSRLRRHTKDGLAVTTEGDRIQWLRENVRFVFFAGNEDQLTPRLF
jgi:hypothetical protein